MHSATLEQLAAAVSGEVVGNRQLEIRGAASFKKAGPNDVTFAGDEAHLRALATSPVGACLVPRSQRDSAGLQNLETALVFVEDPLDAFISILTRFRPQAERSDRGISPDARIHPSAVIGADCNIFPGATIEADVEIGPGCDVYPGVYIGRSCRIGANCVLYPNAVLYADVVLGDRVILHAGAILGADGFGYRFRNGGFEKIPQLGSVEVQDDCEIGACATIDRGMIGATVIGAGTKLDNLVMIGHNCELGRHNAFASQVGLAGSVTTGDYVRCAGQVGVADHVHLGKGSTLGAKAGIHRDIPAGETYIGYPARPEQEQLRIVMATGKVPEMRKQLRELESKVAALSRQVEQLAISAVQA